MKNRGLTDLFVGISIVLLGSLVAEGQPPERSAAQSDRRPAAAADANMKRWLSWDSNGDGKLAKSETQGQLKQFFDRNDGNKDGYLQHAELRALAQRLLKRNAASRGRSNQAAVSDEALLKMAPEGVTIVPNLAYREVSDEPGSERWKLDLAMPTEPGDLARPAIVFVHGGGWRNGGKRKSNFLRPALEYASRGYVCVTVNYRFLEHGPITNCIADVKCAVRWLRAHADQYNVDPDRIGAYGNSAGAHLASMLGLCPKSAGMEGDGPWQDQSSMVQAVCASATPTNWLVPMSDRARQRRQASANSNADATANRPKNDPTMLPNGMKIKISPITYVCADAPPFLMVHEASDPTVGVYHSDEFVKALKAVGATDVTYIRYEDGSGHGTFAANQKETGPAMRKFFDRVLKLPQEKGFGQQ